MKKRLLKGFSLIEMLVVITIIGIIMSAMVVEYSNYIDKSESAIAKQELSQIIQVVDMAISTRTAFIDVDGEKIKVDSFDELEDANDLIFIFETETGSDLSDILLTLNNTEKNISYSRGNVTVTFNYETRKFIDN